MKSAVVASLLLCACSNTPIIQKNGNVIPQKDYQLSNIAKSSLDTVAEFHQQAAIKHLHDLAEKLYKRNPRELRKSGLDLTTRLNQLFAQATTQQSSQTIDILMKAFQTDYADDRVYAYMQGLIGIVMSSYNYQTEFYAFDQLDAQKIYNSARNIEVAAWKLNSSKDANGMPYLIANTPDNLSFERELGKLIADQDTLAFIVADRTNRSINWLAQTAGRMVFLPF
ncbi:hypothetical protein [Sulfuriferula nivalis]|uniref:Uncharacterized protein n=1 Tax=Sulfuriferula nivalis TaxID=2675298 RepID=A0A809RHC9_9PROT|nr:hypothetical protein [Sulfuriferula nivalis]BBP00254.1 hypothetical protein SFSGTM_09620 [Sulfuriferula nivalis]